MKKILSAVLAMILLSTPAFAQVKEVFGESTYVMGDNDSKNDARRLCHLAAKREALEKAGVVIESTSSVLNYEVTKDEINTYTAALVKIETVDEKWDFTTENMKVFIKVKALVDTGELESMLKKLLKNDSAKKVLKEQQDRLTSLEDQLATIQKQLTSSSPADAVILRSRRISVFDDIKDLDARYERIQERLGEKRTSSSMFAKKLVNSIQFDMDYDDIVYIFGEPDKLSRETGKFEMHYGRFIVELNLGQVFSKITYRARSCPNDILLKSYNYNIFEEKTTPAFPTSARKNCSITCWEKLWGES